MTILIVSTPGPQGSPGLNWRSAWSSISVYAPGDGVSYGGASYVALSASQNVTPGTAPLQWDLIAASGSGFSGAYSDLSGKPTIPAAATAMVASGPSHAAGLVPDPGATAGTTRFLREDGTFSVPPGSGGAALSAFYVAPSGYSGAVPTGYTLVTQTSLAARVVMNAGYNIVTIAVGGVGTVNLVVNANPFVVDIIDGDGGLSTVAVNKVTS